jgi:hypothetical protein
MDGQQNAQHCWQCKVRSIATLHVGTWSRCLPRRDSCRTSDDIQHSFHHASEHLQVCTRVWIAEHETLWRGICVWWSQTASLTVTTLRISQQRTRNNGLRQWNPRHVWSTGRLKRNSVNTVRGTKLAGSAGLSYTSESSENRDIL